MKYKDKEDLLNFHLRELPYFRSLLRAVEARFYRQFNLAPPILDIGCGDGHFARAAFDFQLDVGLDPSRGSLLQAVQYRSYRLLIQANGDQIPLPDSYFASAFSNSVLEHIPEVEKVLHEIARVLKPGALFLFCVPNRKFLPSLSLGKLMDRIGLRYFGDLYRSFFNKLSRHHHSDPPEVWMSRLEQTGFRLDRWWHYFPPEALRVLEWGHYFGAPSLVSHWLTRRWVLVPTSWNLALTRKVVQSHFDRDPISSGGVYTFYVAYRAKDSVQSNHEDLPT